MEPYPALDKFRLREIEQQLAADLQAASERLRRAPTEDEKNKATEAQIRALQRFRDFAARGIVPQDLLPATERVTCGSSNL
jgi:hypothetical protein